MKCLPLRLRHGRTEAFGGCGLSIFGFGGFGPAAEIEGDRHAGGAEFVGERAIDEGTGDDNAPNAQWLLLARWRRRGRPFWSKLPGHCPWRVIKIMQGDPKNPDGLTDGN